jgi:hypothetical protein
MPVKFNPATIHPQKLISMQRAFSGGFHKTIPGVALHVGVETKLARAYLRYLIRTKELPKGTPFEKKVVKKKN